MTIISTVDEMVRANVTSTNEPLVQLLFQQICQKETQYLQKWVRLCCGLFPVDSFTKKHDQIRGQSPYYTRKNTNTSMLLRPCQSFRKAPKPKDTHTETATRIWIHLTETSAIEHACCRKQHLTSKIQVELNAMLPHPCQSFGKAPRPKDTHTEAAACIRIAKTSAIEHACCRKQHLTSKKGGELRLG